MTKRAMKNFNLSLVNRPFSAVIAILFALLFFTSAVLARVPDQEGIPVEPQMRITGVDVARLPMIQLRALGRNADGTPIDFNSEPVVINHGGEEITQVEIGGQEIVGTMTVFVVDTPAGIEDRLEAIQDTISAFASEGSMREQIDYVAIYQVGSLTAEQLLPPTQFYNAINNFLVDPLPTALGPTALIDSVVGLLNSAEGLKPDPALDLSLVIISDGTDVVSSQFSEGDVLARSTDLGISIHTILVDNPALSGADDGARFMELIARVSGGISTPLSAGSTAAIWERIGQFRAQTLLRYQVNEPEAGENVPIVLSLAANPEVQSGTTVSISPAAGLLTLEVPSDARALTAQELGEPFRLRLSATSAWLDGESRSLTAAQLWSNGAPLVDINPADLDAFEVELDNLRFGANEIWLTGVDETGREMISPVVSLTVIQGEERTIPEALQPSGVGLLTWAVGCLAGLVLLVVLGWWLFFRGAGSIRLDRLLDVLPKGGSRRRRRRSDFASTSAVDFAGEPAGDPGQGYAAVEPAGFMLEIIAADSPVPSPISLQGYELSLGRAPGQADIVFEQDLTVSRLHASMIREGHSYRLFDEGSTSGTLVNGQPVPEYGSLLIDGDELQIGAVRLRFKLAWDSAGRG